MKKRRKPAIARDSGEQILVAQQVIAPLDRDPEPAHSGTLQAVPDPPRGARELPKRVRNPPSSGRRCALPLRPVHNELRVFVEEIRRVIHNLFAADTYVAGRHTS